MRGVFDSVASRYDVMNDLMSMGLHRAWKAYAVALANLRDGERVLDIAGGTGDLARAFAKKVGRAAWSCCPTSTRPCCARAATALLDKGCVLPTVVCDAESAARSPRRASTWSASPSACAT